MSRTIDERIVQMTFDNKDFEKNANATISTLDKLKNSLNFSTTNNSFDKINDSITSASNNINVMEEVVIGSLRRIGEKITDLGLNIVKSLTIDNITGGFSAYETELKTVQSMMSATGKSAEEIKNALASTTWYADETSYSYEGLTNTIKTFLAQNIELDKSASYVQGIANMAGLAGVEATQATHAMEGFAKAMGSGVMTKQNWQWIKTAGLETANTKQIFLDAAVAAGTLSKAGEGLYKTLSGDEVTIANFAETLSKDWLDATTMQTAFGTLSKYSDVVYKTKDSLEALNGEVLTTSDVLDKMHNITSTSSEGFNEMKKALEEVDAVSYTDEEALARLQEVMNSSSKVGFEAAQAYRTFTDALNATKTGVISAWRKIFDDIFGNISEAQDTWTRFGDWLYDLFVEPFNALEEVFAGWKDLGGRTGLIEGFANIGRSISGILERIRNSFEKVFGTITSEDLYKFTEAFNNLTSKLPFADIEEGAESFNLLEKALTAVKKVLETISNIAGKFADGLNNIANKIKNILSKLGEYFKQIKDSIADFLDVNGMKISSGLGGGLLAYLLINLDLIVTKLKKLKVKDVLDNLTSGSLIGKVSSFFDTLSSSLKKFTEGNLKIKVLKSIATSLIMLSAAMLILSAIKPEQLSSGIKGMTVIIIELLSSLAIISKIKVNSSNINNLTTAVIKISLALLIMSEGLKIISKIDSKDMAKALIGFGVVLIGIVALIGILATVSKNTGSNKIKAIGKAIVSIGFALIEIAAALKIMASISKEGMVSSLKAVSIILLEIGVLIAGLSVLTKSASGIKISLIGAALIGIGFALIEIAAALKILSTINIDKMNSMLLDLGIVLAMIMGFISIISLSGSAGSMILIASAMVILGGALIIFAGAIALLGSLETETLTKGIVALVAALTLIGGVAGILGLVAAPYIIAFAAAIALLGAGILLLASGIGKAVEVMVLLSLLGSDIMTGLIDIFSKLTEIIPALIAALVIGFIQGLVMAAGDIVEGIFVLIVNVINKLADLIRNNAGELGAALGNLASALVTGLIDAIGGFMDSFGDGILGKLKEWFGGKNTEEIRDTGNTMANSYNKGLLDKEDETEDTATYLGTLASSSMEDAEGASKSGNLTVDGFVSALSSSDNLSSISFAGANIGDTLLDSIMSRLDINSPSREAAKIGNFFISGLIKGLTNTNNLSKESSKTGSVMVEALQTGIAKAESIIEDDLNPVITPVLDLSKITKQSEAVSSLFGNKSINSAFNASEIQNRKFNKSGINDVKINVDFTVNNAGKDLTESDVLKFSKQIARQVNEELGFMV